MMFPKYDEVRGFDVNMEVLSMLKIPQIGHTEGVSKSIFVRLDALEDTIPVQTKINAVARDVMLDLNGELQKVGKLFEPMYKDLTDTMHIGFQDVSKHVKSM
jgi:hypothetical protein